MGDGGSEVVLRWIGIVLCALALAGCSPEFDWRVVAVGDGAVTGVLPARPRTETRPIEFSGDRLDLSLTMAQAQDVLFVMGHAALPGRLQGDREAARLLAREVTASFYRNLSVPIPDPLPVLGQRFVIDGQGPSGPVRMEALVGVSGGSLVEAMVMGTQQAFDRAPVQDFWSALKTGRLEP